MSIILLSISFTQSQTNPYIQRTIYWIFVIKKGDFVSKICSTFTQIQQWWDNSLPVKPPWLCLASHSLGKQRSICCICSVDEPWRCPPGCRTSPPRPPPPWTCTPCRPGASWGCPPGRARQHEGSRRAGLARSSWGQPIGRRSWRPKEQKHLVESNILTSPPSSSLWDLRAQLP